jgi:hypothetical protein
MAAGMLMPGFPQGFQALFEALPVRLDSGADLSVTHPADDIFDLQGRQIPQAV